MNSCICPNTTTQLFLVVISGVIKTLDETERVEEVTRNCLEFIFIWIWNWMLTNGSKQSFHNYLVYLTSGAQNRRSPARPAKQLLTSLLLTVRTPWLSPSVSTLIQCQTGIPYKCQQIIISQSELRLTALLNLCNNCHVEVSYWPGPSQHSRYLTIVFIFFFPRYQVIQFTPDKCYVDVDLIGNTDNHYWTFQH